MPVTTAGYREREKGVRPGVVAMKNQGDSPKGCQLSEKVRRRLCEEVGVPSPRTFLVRTRAHNVNRYFVAVVMIYLFRFSPATGRPIGQRVIIALSAYRRDERTPAARESQCRVSGMEIVIGIRGWGGKDTKIKRATVADEIILRVRGTVTAAAVRTTYLETTMTE